MMRPRECLCIAGSRLAGLLPTVGRLLELAGEELLGRVTGRNHRRHGVVGTASDFEQGDGLTLHVLATALAEGMRSPSTGTVLELDHGNDAEQVVTAVVQLHRVGAVGAVDRTADHARIIELEALEIRRARPVGAALQDALLGTNEGRRIGLVDQDVIGLALLVFGRQSLGTVVGTGIGLPHRGDGRDFDVDGGSRDALDAEAGLVTALAIDLVGRLLGENVGRHGQQCREAHGEHGKELLHGAHSFLVGALRKVPKGISLWETGFPWHGVGTMPRRLELPICHDTPVYSLLTYLSIVFIG